ncbi:GTPase/DUF3482 domain-containing protein [Desulfosediminicola sp.]|uniref:GTPase/DUF3482 domain-containing protein n=1 Tax=Desulfosediminicola sp. TaxID=2886825 RepID=UPI003AF2A64F
MTDKTNSSNSLAAPEIALLGHPNEGKSSVLSTLAEDDSVRVSAIPGETTQCRTFPVVIDGRELLRFTDTPGFQNPLRVVAEMRKIAAVSSDAVRDFRAQFKDVPELRDDIELLLPVERGAGIIYVVDGSRPVRNVDRAEMEILRLTGRPRMAIINCKNDDFSQLDNWKNEFRKNFNSNRVFNAHRATYAERILLFEALKSIDQDWQPTLDGVVRAFRRDWEARTEATVDILLELLTECLNYSVSAGLGEKTEDQNLAQQKLLHKYRSSIASKERKAHEQIRALFKHNIFNYQLPPHSILNEDLFSEKTWHLLGMSKKQVAIAGAVGGAVVGAKLDILAAGLSFGVFTGLGSAAGAIGALAGGKKLSKIKNVLGLNLGGEQLKIGPATNISLMLILINRALLFYQHTINWAHGRRDYQSPQQSRDLAVPETAGSEGFTTAWPAENVRVCKAWFSAVTGEKNNIAEHGLKLSQILKSEMMRISNSDSDNHAIK